MNRAPRYREGSARRPSSDSPHRFPWCGCFAGLARFAQHHQSAACLCKPTILAPSAARAPVTASTSFLPRLSRFAPGSRYPDREHVVL